jgi:hypothetical protein
MVVRSVSRAGESVKLGLGIVGEEVERHMYKRAERANLTA